MRFAMIGVLLLLPGLAAAQAPTIETLPCASVTGENPRNPAMLLAAIQGLEAARGGPILLSEVRLGAIRDALPALCAAQPDRPVIAAVATVRVDDPAPLDLGSMTCGQLAPLWRAKARTIVPFVAAYLHGAAVGSAEMDALADRLQATCRQPENADRRVLDLAKAP